MKRSRAAPTSFLSTTCPPRTLPRRSGGRRVARRSRSPAASRSNAFRSWRRPAPISSRSARSHIRRLQSTSALKSNQSDADGTPKGVPYETAGGFAEAIARATTLTTLAAGVALAEGIERATDLRVEVKWPNDLHMSRRKLAGILAESTGETVVLGYGINVATAALPPELRDRATSLESELGRPVDRAIVLVETLMALSRRYEDLLAGRFDAILDAWRARARLAIGARVEWTSGGETLSGHTAGIDDGGALLVRVGDRVERIVSGELTWL